MKKAMKKNVGASGFSPAPVELVKSTEIAVVSQLQERIEDAMQAVSLTRDRLASGLNLTRAMIDHILESPDATLHDLCALAAVLGISFKVTSYRSGV